MALDQANQFDVIGINGIRGFFFQSLDQINQASWMSTIANQFTSNQDTETYAGIGNVPQLREWVGGKNVKSFTEQSVKISNKDWESTIRFKNKDRRRDKSATVQARMGELAERAAAHDLKLLSSLINVGTGTTLATCYDGQPLFSASHTVGSQALNNIVAVTLSGLPVGTAVGYGTANYPSPAAAALSIQQGINQIYTFVDDQGEPINEMATDFVIMAAPAMASVLQAACELPYVGLGLSNPLPANAAPSGNRITREVVSNPRLTASGWTTQFAIFRKGAPFRPLISQLELPPMLKALAEGSDNEFYNNEVLFSVEKSGNVGLGRFDQAVLVQLS
jgi:phage major head subunit gpT-like protein